MLVSILSLIVKSFIFSCGSYSNNVFPDPLSKEEEDNLIKKHLNGDIDARNKLIEHNLRLVAHIVKKFEKNVSDTDDLISIGTIGLIKGIDSYSLDKGTRITTYSARCIENEILMYFRTNKKLSKNISLNEQVGFDKDGNEITFIDILKTPDPNYADEINKKDNIMMLNKYFGVLTDREKEIIIKRYGFLGYKEMTQKEIAKNMNISRSYVSRIEKRALTKILREYIKDKKDF